MSLNPNTVSTYASRLKYLKDNWLGLAGLILGAIGLYLSYYFYEISKQVREPIFLENRTVELFSSPEAGAASKFQVVNKETGAPVAGKLFVQEFTFWNNGTLSVRKENVLEPVGLQYPKGVEIIAASLTAASRPKIVQPTIEIDRTTNRVLVHFVMLDKGDGLRFQVIYSGEATQAAQQIGTIESVSTFSGRTDLRTRNLFYGFAMTLAFGAALIIGSILFISMFALPAIIAKRFPSLVAVVPAPIHKIFGIASAAFPFVLIIGMLIAAIVSGTVKLADKEAEQSAPAMDPVLQQ